MSEIFDAVVIGGGPAGSATAGLLAQRGRRVVVLEKEHFPRFHIGESLLPRSLPVLEQLGLTAELEAHFIRKPGAQFWDSATGRRSYYRFAEAIDPSVPFAYQVPRATFDDLLLRAAGRLGAEIREGTRVERVVFDGARASGVEVRAPDGTTHHLAASFVIDASGRDALLAGRQRTKQRIDGLEQHAFFAHWEGVWRETGEAAGNIQIVIFEHGWFWFIPFAGETTSVGFVCTSEHARSKGGEETLEGFFERTVALSPFAAEWLARARRTAPVRATADFSYRVGTLAGPGWLLVGDAAGFIDPLFSTGVHLALAGATRAAAHVDATLTPGSDEGAGREAYVRGARSAAELCVGVVQSFYRGEFRETLFAPDQRPTLRRVITALLSGDVVDDGAPWRYFVAESYPAR